MVQTSLLRVLTCGSVDDGKSTLIGRLLHDCGVLYDDQLMMLEKERTEDGLPDFSCLLDGLLAEREQAITIDVAYRSFTTKHRRYMVIDAPGHEQYTRNMVTGASHADVALLLVDASKGLLQQTQRHTCIASLIGIQDIIVAINKMDKCEYSHAVFSFIEQQYQNYVKKLGFRSVVCIPVSALHGDNICHKSLHTDWYTGQVLLDLLEEMEPATAVDMPFRMPIQWVARQSGLRGLAGTVVAGSVQVGQEVIILPAGTRSTVQEVLIFGGTLQQANTEQAICIRLADELDISRGDMLAEAANPPEVADHFVAHIVWLDEPPLVSGRSYLFRLGTAWANATITELSSRLDIETLQPAPVKQLQTNEVGRIKIALDRPLPLAPYKEHRDLGGFLLIDRLTSKTLGAGMINFTLRRSHNLYWHDFELNKAALSAQKVQKACVLWFTGLSGAGKSTLANLVARHLHAQGRHVYILDGDNLRCGLNRDLGFTERDRAENIRRASEVAYLMVDAGLLVLASFISPFRTDRAAIRERFAPGEFYEVFVDTPLSVCEDRDPKGLYKRARAGTLPNFTGISASFEPPEHPDLHLDGSKPLDVLVQELMAFTTTILTPA